MTLDHMILPVNDRQESLKFYAGVLGLTHDGDREPFSTVRVSPDLVLQLAGWGTTGGVHLAFALSPDEFDSVFRRIQDEKIEYGDSFESVGNQKGPGVSDGARGDGEAVYLFDPNRHLIEIRRYA